MKEGASVSMSRDRSVQALPMIYLVYFGRNVLAGVTISKLGYPDHDLQGPSSLVAKEACDSVQWESVPRGPAIEGDMYQAWTLLQSTFYLFHSLIVLLYYSGSDRIS